MAVRDKSAALDELGGDLERGEPLRGEKTTIDDSYLDGLSSKLDSEPKLVAPPPMPRAPGLSDDDDPVAEPPLGLASTGPVGKRRPPTNEELGSFDAQPIPSEPTQLEEEDELAGAATRIFIGDENAAQAAQLEVSAGRDRGKVFVLSAETTSVGRGVDNDFILTDIASSRRHLKIHKRDGYYELEDLGSGNGTLRNGKKIAGKVVLLAGDKIELGNTTLVFAWDGTPPPGVLESTASLDMGAGTPPMPAPGALARPAIEQIARPRGAPAGTGSGPAAAAPGKGPNKVILFGGIAVGVLMIIGIVIAKVATSSPATPAAAPAPSVTELQTTGVNAFAARQWDTALRAFEQLAAVAPNDPSIRDYITRCQEERAAEQSLAQARLLGATSPRDAITALAAIPGQSVYAQEAAALRLEVTGRRVAEILRSVQSARQEPTPDVVRIMALVDEGLTLDAGNGELQAIRSELGSGLPAPSATTATGPTPTASPGTVGPSSPSTPDAPRGAREPRGPRGQREPREPRTPREPREPPPREPRAAPVATNAKVLQLFKSGRFREASDAASAIAESATGRAADQARSLARDIDRFSNAWSGAQGGDGASKIRNLETALRLDRAISGGHYGSQIQPLLLRAHTDNATRAWQAGRYPSACQSVQAALRLDGRNSTAVSMSRDCASKARDLYEQGYSLRTSNPDRARELWRQVLQMVSRDNEYYTRAYDRLNNSQSGSGRDEDE